VRFAALGSGSRGNGWLIESGTTVLLVDSGFPLRETRVRLARLGLDVEDLSAVVITHEHGDHIRGIGPLARSSGLPVWMTHGTRQALRDDNLPGLRLFDSDTPFAIGDLEVLPFAVPHDAREPCQLTIGDGVHRLGLLTDLGSLTPHVERSLAGCDALVLEANHDTGMLRDGPYHEALKRRVGGDLGHLSNAQAAALLGRLDLGRLHHLIAAHLSETNNSQARVRASFAAVLGCADDEVSIADQENGLGWRDLG